jgi:hypothetical protein
MVYDVLKVGKLKGAFFLVVYILMSHKFCYLINVIAYDLFTPLM